MAGKSTNQGRQLLGQEKEEKEKDFNLELQFRCLRAQCHLKNLGHSTGPSADPEGPRMSLSCSCISHEKRGFNLG